MTADSLPNVEARYDSFYDKLERRDSKMSSHANKKFGSNMAYRIMANGNQLGPSSMYGRPFDDVEEMEVGRSLLLNEGRLVFFVASSLAFARILYKPRWNDSLKPAPHFLRFGKIENQTNTTNRNSAMCRDDHRPTFDLRLNTAPFPFWSVFPRKQSTSPNSPCVVSCIYDVIARLHWSTISCVG